MADTSGILSRLQASLSVYDPTWDVSVGSATYKILESVASEIAIANNNSVLQTYSYDINTKSGIELDTFCNLFGIYRQLGKRATGVVTFSINTPATNIYDIPVGTQVAVPIGPNYTSALYYATTAPAIIGVGDTSVDVPVVSVLPGAINNIPVGAITTKVSNLVGITSVKNNSAITNGLDPESDSALRARWTSTAFNNTTGTPGRYTTTALQDPNVSLVNTISQDQYYSEQLQINAVVSGSGNPTILIVAYSGMVNTISGTTYSGTTIVASGSYTTTTTASALAAGITTLISGVTPASFNQNFVVTGSGNTVASGVQLTFNAPSPYKLVLGSGYSLPGASVTTSGVTTISGTSYYSYVKSNNPDVGFSGTLSYNNTFSGAIYPQGNELVGNNLNAYNQVVYTNLTDYYYPSNPTAQLQLVISNSNNLTALLPGNSVQVVSEYLPASSRSTAVTSGNYVDIFINGTTSNSTTEQLVFNPNFTLSSGNSTSYLDTTNYILASGSLASSNAAVATDIYVPLNQQPAINFPSQLSTATSGIADTIYVYNVGTSSGATYPIALNPYPWTTFTGTVVSGATNSGTNFISVTTNNGLGNLFPGMALASGVMTSGTQFYITQVTNSGIYMNQNVTLASGTGATSAVISGKSMVYPIYDTTDNQNSVLQKTGLAFDSATPPVGWPSALPSLISWATYTHGYNTDVVSVESLIQQSRPFGTNTLVHQASYVKLTINVRIVFSSSYSQSTVQSSIYNQIAQYFNNFGYLGAISFANVTTQILSVAGVSNAKITSINTVAIDGTITGTYTNDFLLASNQLPSLYGINYTITGNSNF